MIPDLAGLLVVAQDWEGHHDFGGGWWIVMVLAMLLFWSLVVLGVVWAARTWFASRPTSEAQGTTPLEILERRLADGSISVEEYEERRRVLQEPRQRPGADPGP